MTIIDEDILKKIGKKIRECRLKKGLTQRQLADMAKASPSYISKLENGKLDCCIYIIFILAKVFDAKAYDFLK